MEFDINMDAAVVFTNQLEKMHRSALPVAVRETLNGAAFDVKMNTMPDEAEDAFVIRKKNFFKAKSSVDRAKGFDISSMEAVVGFIGDDQAVKDLEAQEHGGEIEGRSFIPMDTARSGNSHDNQVRPSNRITTVKNIINSNTMEGKSAKQQFVNAVSKAGKGGFVLGNNDKQTLFRVKNDGRDFKLTPLFSYEKGRDVSVSKTEFMQTATEKSAQELNSIYQKQAEKQIERIRKK